MGTEIKKHGFLLQKVPYLHVKLNNPQMGTEMYFIYYYESKNAKKLN